MHIESGITNILVLPLFITCMMYTYYKLIITGLTNGQIIGIIIGALSLVTLTLMIIISAIIVLFKQRNKRLGYAWLASA